jgi:hypothetical protein
MNTPDAIERSAAECLRFPQTNEPPRLLESSLAGMNADQRGTLCGKKGVDRWAAFKEQLLAHQADMWQPTLPCRRRHWSARWRKGDQVIHETTFSTAPNQAQAGATGSQSAVRG